MENKHNFTPDPGLKLMDQVRQVLRYHHYAITTERTYCKWILRFIHHFGVRCHPRDMGAVEIETFLSHLASAEKISAATQRQALNGIVFLYKHVLNIEVRFGKGGKDRGVPLPKSLIEKVQTQLNSVKRIHGTELAEGFGEAWLPEGFARKIGPAARDLGWQYLFPAKKRSIDPRSGKTRRHHVLASGLQKAVRTSVRRARANQTRYLSHVSPQLRHSPTRKRRQYQDRAGVDGSCRRQDH